jgi:hypothetical protein
VPALLWLLAGGGAAVGLLLLGMGWGKSIERGAWRAIEVRRLESRLADTRRQHAVALAYEADRAARAEAARLVARVVERVVERPVYRNQCIDADGVRLLDHAAAGTTTAARQPDDAVPAPAGAERGGAGEPAGDAGSDAAGPDDDG